MPASILNNPAIVINITSIITVVLVLVRIWITRTADRKELIRPKSSSTRRQLRRLMEKDEVLFWTATSCLVLGGLCELGLHLSGVNSVGDAEFWSSVALALWMSEDFYHRTNRVRACEY